MKLIFDAFRIYNFICYFIMSFFHVLSHNLCQRVTIGTYTVLNRCNWTGISTGFNMELVVTNTKTCKNVSMANISNIRNISFVSKYKLKFSICPYIDTIISVIKYWVRLCKNTHHDPLLREAYEENLLMYGNNEPCWLKCIRKRVRMFLWLIFLISEI
jgi:hypothetical protein